MNKQITLSTFSDELANVRTKKKEFLAQIDRIVPWGEMGRGNQAVLLQRRARKQALRFGTDAADLYASKSV